MSDPERSQPPQEGAEDPADEASGATTSENTAAAVEKDTEQQHAPPSHNATTMMSEEDEKSPPAAESSGTLKLACVGDCTENTAMDESMEKDNNEATETPAVEPVDVSKEEDKKEVETTAVSRSEEPSVVTPQTTELTSPRESNDRPAASSSPASPTTSSSTRSGGNSNKLLLLPMDALHGIASFLTLTEWCCTFGALSRASNNISREIVANVRMHGFKCATEIVTAWKLGSQEDARELAVLYVSKGVPVYPRSLGHSLHTLLWKMQVEAKELLEKSGDQEEQDQGNNNNNAAEEGSAPVDPFYQSRGEFRATEGISSDMTYLEIKSLFWMQKEDGQPPASQPNRSSSPVRDLIESRVQTSSNVGSDLPTHKRKLPVRIHQHLLDQHVQGRACADDLDGTLVTPPISLSADFYHPQGRRRSRSTMDEEQPGFDTSSRSSSSRSPDLVPPQDINDGVDAAEFRQHLARTLQAGPPARLARRLEPGGEDIFDPVLQQRSPFKDHSVLDFLDLEVYSAASIPLYKPQNPEDSRTVEWTLQSRFDSYQRRLKACLARSDNVGFEDCLLDFWDEAFPASAGFQYYDRHTAVPRISNLREFLTKPCPKSVGVVQCEIERVKTTSRGKGVSMKGRLFPTYEYRLFIRNRPHNPLSESALMEDDDFVRRDTVLMVAKNRGRKHTESSGIVSMSSPKKGSNNYFLQMPDQMDVDAHFNKVNREESQGRMNPNGAGHEPVLASGDTGGGVLGRLQSNFIGTEFQIFVPRLRKRPLHKPSYYSPSEDELDYDSGVSSDNNSSRRTRFGRLSLRRSSAHSDVILADGSSRVVDRQFLRTTSSPEIQRRSNRRAIANTPDTPQQQPPQQQHRPYLWEEEDGLITYTANLLGNRPRIMDVCIPKVAPNGVAGAEWRKHVETTYEQDQEECDMLTAFRQLLQQIENQEQNAAPEGGDAGDNPDEGNAEPVEDYGLRALQNRPPWWNIELGSFVLNFGGRVSVASVKNFQLCDRDDQDKILLQFGRIQGRHSFTMDFQHPLTPVQAFSISLSSLQSKLSFG